MRYCQSDVALLKAGCQAFHQEFERQAGFNPMAKCMTIASDCNLYWRKHHLPPHTIPVEPLRGWRGANVNQSLKALQWLYYREQLLPKEGASAYSLRHVRNGGEQSVRVWMDSYFVDGYDPSTRTVYEFHGCLYHGCPRCYHTRRAIHYAVPDRTVEELYRATHDLASSRLYCDRTMGMRVGASSGHGRDCPQWPETHFSTVPQLCPGRTS